MITFLKVKIFRRYNFYFSGRTMILSKMILTVLVFRRYFQVDRDRPHLGDTFVNVKATQERAECYIDIC